MNMNEVKPANEAQKRLFFALCNDGGFDSDKMKERAKLKYGLEHFNDISSTQISELIDKLQNKVAFAGYEQATSGEAPMEQPTPKNKYSYRFTVSIMASELQVFDEVFEKVSKNASDILGERIKIDAKMPIGTITANTKKELTEEELKKMSARLETEFKAKLSIPSVSVEVKKDDSN